MTLLSKAGEAVVVSCRKDIDDGIALLIRAAGLTVRFNYPSGFDPDPSKIKAAISFEV